MEKIIKGTKIVDITGNRYGMLVVESFHSNVGYKPKWLCKCDCGNSKIINGTAIKSGNTTSCGCLRVERLKAALTIHGQSTTPEYQAWYKMQARCYSKNDPSYSCYGGRGISVCSKWRESFESFFADMGARPSKRHSLDRIDPNGNYEPSNCRWATQAIQQTNKRTTVFLTYKGESLSMTDWCKKFKVHTSWIRGKLRFGKSIEDVFEELEILKGEK